MSARCKRYRTGSITEILIVIVARIGDTLLATPAMAALRKAYPNAHISVLAHPKRMEVLQHLDCIDRLAAITKQRAWWCGRIGPKRFDMAFVYGGDQELIRYAARVSRRVVAFEQGGLPDSPHFIRVPRHVGAPLHAVEERLLLVKAIGASAADMHLRYTVTQEERQAAIDWLVSRFSADFRPLIALQVSSFPTKAHRDWPVESFMELVAELLACYPNSRFLILGDAEARGKGRLLHRRFGHHMAVAAGETTLRRSAALMSCADLYIGVDTGPTHIAGALGIPMIALYHSAYPGRYLAPLRHPRCVIIEHPMTGLSSSTNESMSDVPVSRVLAAARHLMDGRGDQA